MKKKLLKNKIVVTVIYIIAVLLTPLLIGAIGMLLPKVFNPAIETMYVVHGILSIAGTMMIVWMWLQEFIGRE